MEGCSDIAVKEGVLRAAMERIVYILHLLFVLILNLWLGLLMHSFSLERGISAGIVLYDLIVMTLNCYTSLHKNTQQQKVQYCRERRNFF